MIGDLRKDASPAEIDAYVGQTGRRPLDAWATKRTLRWLTRRAYTRDQFERMAQQSRFGTCAINANSIGFEVQFAKRIVAPN